MKMEKDGLPTYSAVANGRPPPQPRHRRIRKSRSLKLLAVACLVFLAYAQWSQLRVTQAGEKKNPKLSLDRLHQDLATCAKLQHKPQDPTGPRTHNARHIPGHAPTLIRNATVWTGEAPFTWAPSVDVLLHHGLIHTLSTTPLPPASLPPDTLIHDAGGRALTAGLIDTHSHAGVYQLPDLHGWRDVNEASAPITPFVRSIDGLHPLDAQFNVIKSGGVTTSLVLPGSANNIGGEAVAVKHAVGPRDGRAEVSARDMLADPDEGRWRYMKMACGENAKGLYGKAGEHGPASRLGESWEFRHAFEQAAQLVAEQDDWCRVAGEGGVEAVEGYLPQDLRWEALGAVLRGQVHVNAHCYTVPDLEAFVDHTNEFKFAVRAFHHAHETYLVPEILKRAWGGRAPAAALFANNMFYKAEAYRGIEQAGKILYENGITPVYVSDNPVLNAQHVVFEAAKAYRNGLPYHAALAGVTSAPAELLGLGERIGKVKAGFDADVVVWDSDPLSVGATPVQVWIDGTAQFEDPYVLNKSSTEPIDPSKPVTPALEDGVETEGLVLTGVAKILIPGYTTTSHPANVVIQNGQITCVGPCQPELHAAASTNVRTIHLENGHLSPAFTLLGSALGLSEISSEPNTQDGRHDSFAHFSRAVDGLLLANKQLAAAHRHGVTRAISAPISVGGGAASRGVSAGFLTGAAHALEEGAVWADEVAVHYALTPGAAKQGKTPSISSAVGELRDKLLQAAAALNETTTPAARYEEHAYLTRVVAGDLPLVLHVHSADTIAALLRVKTEVEDAVPDTHVRLSIVGGAEAHLVAAELAAAGVGVVLAPLLAYAKSWDQRRSLVGAPLTNGTAVNALLDAGVVTAIGITQNWEARDVALLAGIAYANGEGRLSEAEALALAGGNVYELLGLERERAAGDFVVFEGNPLEIRSRVVAVGSGRGGVAVYSS